MLGAVGVGLVLVAIRRAGQCILLRRGKYVWFQGLRGPIRSSMTRHQTKILDVLVAVGWTWASKADSFSDDMNLRDPYIRRRILAFLLAVVWVFD